MHAAQSYGHKDNSMPSGAGFPDTTIFAALSRKGVSNRYFFSDLPVSALWGARGLARSGRIEEYYERCRTGKLPALSFVDPSFANEAGGTSGDEHPHGDVRVGQAFMSDVVHAFLDSPHWRRGALFIVYDEWGGFFDHVAPPRVPDIRASRDLDQDFGQLGLRIPAIAVSPWVRRHHVDHSRWSFESILKMIEYRFGLAPLTVRDRHAPNIAQAFDWRSRPRLAQPDLPEPAIVVGGERPTAGPSARAPAGGRPGDNDLSALLHSGYLERLGFRYRPATLHSTFRAPSSIDAALTGR